MFRIFLGILVLLLLPTFAFAGGEHPEPSEPAWWLIALFTLNGMVIWLFSQGRYLVWKDGELRPAFTELQEFSSFLLAGTVIAQLWVHGDPDSYNATVHAVLASVPSLDLDVSFQFLVNDVFMALFFGIAAKELVEATMKPDGPLRGLNGFLPMAACVGGVIGPAIVYRLICTPEMSAAWAVPCATDIAFAWLGARIIWGRSHPAVTFLLAVAVADDFIGMGIIAICYPQRPFDWWGIVLLGSGVMLALAMSRLSRKFGYLRVWQLYFVPGLICWSGLLLAGLHSALALVFVVPFIPTEGRDRGIFAGRHARLLPSFERLGFAQGNSLTDVNHRRMMDPLNRFEEALRPLVDTGLFFFGLANAGVPWIGSSAWDMNSWAVFLGLGIGKTLGISGMMVVGYPLLRLLALRRATPITDKTQQYVKWRDVPFIGLLGAMGFTVALFVADAAGAQDSLKLGAMASFGYLGVAIVAGRWWLGPHRNVVSSMGGGEESGPTPSNVPPGSQ